jgi:hypothetical protein
MRNLKLAFGRFVAHWLAVVRHLAAGAITIYEESLVGFGRCIGIYRLWLAPARIKD